MTIEKIKHFVSKEAFNIDGFGKKIVENFWKLKMIRLPQDIFSLNYEKIKTMDGWGQQSVANLRYAIEEKKGVFVIKCEINYRKEINLHENFDISIEELVCKGKKLVVGLRMLNANNETIADYKILNLNVDLETKKSSAFSKKIIAQLA